MTLEKELKLMNKITSLERELADLKRVSGLRTCKTKADKYDKLLPKHQALMVENAILVKMMTDMRVSLQNVLKSKGYPQE